MIAGTKARAVIAIIEKIPLETTKFGSDNFEQWQQTWDCLKCFKRNSRYWIPCKN
jgi:hypothetical protein